jgi:hypothetical protein
VPGKINDSVSLSRDHAAIFICFEGNAIFWRIATISHSLAVTALVVDDRIFLESNFSASFKKQFQGQGCQIFLGTTYQNGKNIPNNNKTYQMSKKLIETKWP